MLTFCLIYKICKVYSSSVSKIYPDCLTGSMENFPTSFRPRCTPLCTLHMHYVGFPISDIDFIGKRGGLCVGNTKRMKKNCIHMCRNALHTLYNFS